MCNSSPIHTENQATLLTNITNINLIIPLDNGSMGIVPPALLLNPMLKAWGDTKHAMTDPCHGKNHISSSQVSRTSYLCNENPSDTLNKYSEPLRCTAVASKTTTWQWNPGIAIASLARIPTQSKDNKSFVRYLQMLSDEPIYQKNGKQTDCLVVHPNIVLHPQNPASPTFVKF